MRILQLINRLEAGGAERMLCCLAMALREKRHEVSIVCLRDADCMPVPLAELDRLGIELTTLQKEDGFSLKTVREIAACAERLGADVIHTHNPLVHHYGVLAGRMARVPAVLNTLHGSATLEMSSFASVLYGLSCWFGDEVVAVCDTAETDFRRLINSHVRTTVIANGIDTTDLAAIPERPGSKEVVFGTMARLVPVKNHVCLIEAFAKVEQRIDQCRLEILGSGELETELKALCARIGIQDKIVFKPWTNHTASFLADLDVFVLSSLSEGLPLAPLEAMAAGRPIVSTAIGAMPAIVRGANCGWICELGDSQSLAEAMYLAAINPERREKGRRARRYIFDHYSLAGMADKYERLYLDLLQSRRGKAQVQITT